MCNCNTNYEDPGHKPGCPDENDTDRYDIIETCTDCGGNAVFIRYDDEENVTVFGCPTCENVMYQHGDIRMPATISESEAEKAYDRELHNEPFGNDDPLDNYGMIGSDFDSEEDLSRQYEDSINDCGPLGFSGYFGYK